MTYPRFVITAGEPAAVELPHRGLRQRHHGTRRVRRHLVEARPLEVGHRLVQPNGATSTTRNTYLHGITLRAGRSAARRVHLAGGQRRGPVQRRRPGQPRHGYVYSDDRGRTWRNGAGALVGHDRLRHPGLGRPARARGRPAHVDHGLINQESQASTRPAGRTCHQLRARPVHPVRVQLRSAQRTIRPGLPLSATPPGLGTRWRSRCALGATGRSQSCSTRRQRLRRAAVRPDGHREQGQRLDRLDRAIRRQRAERLR